MEFAEALERRSRSPTAIFHRFRVDATIHQRRHIFVEGYDDLLVYSSLSVRYRQDAYKYHICFGKKSLDIIYQLYSSSDLGETNTVFIRDSDYDLYLGNISSSDRLFLTKGYSVENYVCALGAIKAIISSSFGVDEEEYDIWADVGRFENYILSMFSWLKPFHGAVFKALRESRTLDLNQLNFAEHFKSVLDGNALPMVSGLPELNNIGLQLDDFSDESLLLAERFSEQDGLLWLRGKFLVEALSIFLQRLETELRKLHKSGGITRFNRRIHPDFSANILLERLAGYIPWEPALLQAITGQD